MSVFQSHRCDKSSEMKTLQVQYGLKSSYQQASKETYRLQGRVHQKLEFEVNCPWHVIQNFVSTKLVDEMRRTKYFNQGTQVCN